MAGTSPRRGIRAPRRRPSAARCESPARSPHGRSARETTSRAGTAPRRTSRAERSTRPELRRCGFWPPGDPSCLRGLANPRQTSAVAIVSFALRGFWPQIHGSFAKNPGGCMTRARECMSRRQWLAAGATLAGYALAAAPSLAQAVRTDEAGLATSLAEITVGDVAMPVYEARPAAAARVPIVVLLSEIWGVHEYIRDCARRFAKAGYCAVAPELFARRHETVRRPREGRQPERGDGRLSRRGPRIPRRLPAVVSAGGGRGGLGEVPAVLRAPSARLRRKSAC